MLLVFWSIVIDTITMELCLPKEKLAWLNQLMGEWLGKKPRASVRKRDLASLAGHLQHACVIVRPGRIFCSIYLTLWQDWPILIILSGCQWALDRI